MSNQGQAEMISNEIGNVILQDPKLAHGTWNAFTLVILPREGATLNYGFIYDIKGVAKPFRTEVPEHLLSELKASLLEDGKEWLACRLEMKAAGWEMSWEFEYEDVTRFLPHSDMNLLARELMPDFEDDQFWQCPLGYNVLAKLRILTPEICQDFEDRDLHCMISNCFLKAMKYGLSTRTDLAGFALTCFEVAPNFDHHPAVRAGFHKVAEVPGPVWNLLYASVPEYAWAQMREEHFYDGKAWFDELPKALNEEVA
jgi:hypothetical protein